MRRTARARQLVPLAREAHELDVAAQETADVARAVLRDEAVHRPLRAGSRETVGMSDDPRGHVAAVRAAHHADALGIAEVEAAERLVEYGHDVLVVDRAPPGAALDGPANRPPPVFAVAGRAARVRVEDDVACACVDLELVEELVSVLRERPAVDIEQDGVAPARFEAGGAHDPGLDLGPVR